MNPNKRRDRETGRTPGGQDNSKKLAVKELIERYYYQLTEGCGREGCSNENCASSGRLRRLSPNEAAARALHLMMAKAALCDRAASNHTVERAPEASSCRLTEPSSNTVSACGEGATSAEPAGASQQMDLDSECSSYKHPIASDTVTQSEKSANGTSINTTVLAASSLKDELRPQEMEIDLYCTFSDTSPLTVLPKKPMSVINALSPQEKPATSGTTAPTEAAPKAPRTYRMLTEELLLNLVSECRSCGNYTPLIHALGQVFSREKFLKRSFPRRPSPSSEDGGLTKEDLRAMEGDMDKDQDSLELEGGAASSDSDDMLLEPSLSEVVPDGVSRNVAAMLKELNGLVNQDIPVDVESVRRSYDVLFSIPDLPFLDALVNAIMILCENLEIGLKYHKAYQRDPSMLSVFPRHGWPNSGGAQCPPHRLRNTLNALHQVLTARVIEGHFGRDFGVADDELLVASIKTMKILFMSNVLGGELEQCREEEDEVLTTDDGRPLPKDPSQMLKDDPLWDLLGVKVADCRKPLIPWEEFYNEPLSEQLETDRGFVHSRGANTKEGHFSIPGPRFCPHACREGVGPVL
ncbi:hypothetical protein MTO96_012938 [Rhipicephalus appendiculatus]